MHQNYFRDYRPEQGRYLQSDPIGLEGGENLWGYVKSKPFRNRDQYGLVDSCCKDSPRPPPNGCGGGPTSYVVPNEPFSFNFLPCCNGHDNCYAKCRGLSKGECDGNFLSCMSSVCEKYKNLDVEIYRICMPSAATYFVAVNVLGGPFFYLARRGCCE